jgi:hypothetical protein
MRGSGRMEEKVSAVRLITSDGASSSAKTTETKARSEGARSVDKRMVGRVKVNCWQGEPS